MNRLESEWQSFSQRVSVDGRNAGGSGASAGAKEPPGGGGARAVKQAVEKVQEFGCLVKDLDIGLIDFPTLLKGEEVYLCWKLGEAGIRFWHGVQEGFRGRKPIDCRVSGTTSRRVA